MGSHCECDLRVMTAHSTGENGGFKVRQPAIFRVFDRPAVTWRAITLAVVEGSCSLEHMYNQTPRVTYSESFS